MLLLQSLWYFLVFSAATSTEPSVLRYVSPYGYFLFILWPGTVYSLLCLLYTENLLSPVPSLLCTYYSCRDGVLCFLSLFCFLSTLATLDSFSLFLCPNPALSFTDVSVCLIYNNVSVCVSLDRALLGIFLSVV
jgi:hypothetical protein